MSSWLRLEAAFKGDNLNHEKIIAACPHGSEGGPGGWPPDEGGYVFVYGDLRDMDDGEDSAEILAWFEKHIRDCAEGFLFMRFTDGPCYIFDWEGGALTRRKGVLE